MAVVFQNCVCCQFPNVTSLFVPKSITSLKRIREFDLGGDGPWMCSGNSCKLCRVSTTPSNNESTVDARRVQSHCMDTGVKHLNVWWAVWTICVDNIIGTFWFLCGRWGKEGARKEFIQNSRRTHIPRSFPPSLPTPLSIDHHARRAPRADPGLHHRMVSSTRPPRSVNLPSATQPVPC